MGLKEGNKLYVRVDKASGKKVTNKDAEEHMDYVKKIAEERFFVGGMFGNVNGGMILMEAKDLKEARTIFTTDPLIENGLYNCDIFSWKLMVLSEQ